jgi:RNA polymerase sigma-70 factor (ECF subfamily)
MVNTEHDALKTSWTLVARLKNLDDGAHWQEFCQLYSGLIIGVARRAGLREAEAEDALQATMVSVSKNISNFEANPTRGSFHAWLLKLARWRICDQLRKRMPLAELPHDARESTEVTPPIERIPAPQEADLGELCDAEWRQQLLKQAMKELQVAVKAEHYQVFHLLIIEQKPVSEVAQILGKNQAHVYLIKHRVGRILKQILKQLEKKLG